MSRRCSTQSRLKSASTSVKKAAQKSSSRSVQTSASDLSRNRKRTCTEICVGFVLNYPHRDMYRTASTKLYRYLNRNLHRNRYRICAAIGIGSATKFVQDFFFTQYVKKSVSKSAQKPAEKYVKKSVWKSVQNLPPNRSRICPKISLRSALHNL